MGKTFRDNDIWLLRAEVGVTGVTTYPMLNPVSEDHGSPHITWKHEEEKYAVK